MERAFIVTDGTFAGADASAHLKRVLFLSSLPALAGGLWRFAPLPGFSAICRSLSSSTRTFISMALEFYFDRLRPRNMLLPPMNQIVVLLNLGSDVDVMRYNMPFRPSNSNSNYQ
ncbi:MAG: hypothetical protein K1562_16190 [Candidatus Thiodiazotropha sp. (ex. Lucinisca nassula)]|nr:hypothetical protein [Candidatus Thiodiazotropha sp. (ex. Lucinisca nassula)]